MIALTNVLDSLQHAMGVGFTDRHVEPRRCGGGLRTMTKARWLTLMLLPIVLGAGSGVAEGKQHPHSSEQTHFSAEESGVKAPVAVPADVLAILSKDGTVRSIMENENILPKALPPSWFSASAIHLSTAKKTDLVVVGEPPVSGGSVAVFWVFRATARGFELVLKASAHNLIVKNTRWKKYRDIELRSTTAVEFSKVLCRFDGKRYREFKTRSEPTR